MSDEIKVTEEHLKMIPEFVEEWLQLSTQTDKEKAENAINAVYAKMDLSTPKVIWGLSPKHCVDMALLCHEYVGDDSEKIQHDLTDILKGEPTEKIRDKFIDTVRSTGYVPVWWRSWSGYYEFCERNLGVKYDKDIKNTFESFVNNIAIIIPYEGICFVSENPEEIHWRGDRIHHETGMAVKFKDGWGWYAWNGVVVPEQYIMNPDSITKADIIEQKNAELRRCIQEILGDNEFAKRMDLQLIDSDTDELGKPIELYKSKEVDEIAEDYLYFICLTDSSTDRQYYLCVQPTENVWDARAATFQMSKDEYKPQIQT